MDDATFTAVASRFNFSLRTVAQLRRVLVEGQASAEVAREFGVSRQTLSNKVVKIRRTVRQLEQEEFAARVASDRLALEQLLNRIGRD